MNIRIAQVAFTIFVVSTFVTACQRSQGGSTAAPPKHGFPSEEMFDQVPVGHAAGAIGVAPALSTPNPYHGQAEAIQEGKALYKKMNCAGCHAYDASGNMGPSLIDSDWRYGGLPIQIYKSIHDGRPKGMPAWGDALPPADIWKIVAYIESLGGAAAVTDSNGAVQGDKPGEQVAPEAQEGHPSAPQPDPRTRTNTGAAQP